MSVLSNVFSVREVRCPTHARSNNRNGFIKRQIATQTIAATNYSLYSEYSCRFYNLIFRSVDMIVVVVVFIIAALTAAVTVISVNKQTRSFSFS